MRKNLLFISGCMLAAVTFVLLGLVACGYNGIYEQGDWGSPNSVSYPHVGGWIYNVTSWSFTMCDHNGLGPLHGTWSVKNGTAIPLWQDGVFPVDSRLLITIQDNMIVKVEVHSWFVYGD